MDYNKTFIIKQDDGLFLISKKVYVTEEEEKEIIKILEEAGIKPSKIETKAWVTSLIIGGFIFYLAERYALDPLFGEVDKKIKALLLKDNKRKYEYEQYQKNKRE